MDDARGKPAILSGLLRPEAYPHAVHDLRVLETHISWVVLTGEFAYKIKKPVHFNFVDYSTLELRRACCEEELRLNRRLAPELYLDVIPISGSPDRCRVGGTGGAIEFAVRMRQFDQQALLADAMLAGRVTERDVADFGRRLAAFHLALGDPVPQGLGRPDAIAKSVGDVFALLREHAPASHAKLVDEIDAWRQAEHSLLEETFAARLREGFVRECHGDLHLGNLLLLDDRIVAFDGIEFNPSLRWIDVQSETAFLFMDLEAERRRDAAFPFLNAYLEVTGDYAGAPLLPYYIVYRAAVRAAVTLLRCEQVSDADALTSLHGTAERYLKEAKRWGERPQASLAIMHGVSGSGKSFTAANLVREHGAIRLRSDLERKRMFGVSPGHPAPPEAYSSEATSAVYRRLEELAEKLLSAGLSVIVDATFLRRDERRRFGDLAKRLSVPFCIWDCHAPRDVLEQRIRARQQSSSDPSDATIEVLEAQLRRVEPLDEAERAISVLSRLTGSTPSPVTR